MRAQLTELIEERDLALVLAEEEEIRANSFFADRESALAELVERDQRVWELENLVRSLRRRLVASDSAAEAYSPPEEQAAPPATFAELLDWIDSDLTLVEFSGNRNKALALDRSPEAGTWVRSSWEVLRAMQAYAESKTSKNFAGDFKMWCETSPIDSYVIPSGKVVRDESETVRNKPKWRREREFAVPNEVSVSRQIFMGAHVRIGASGVSIRKSCERACRGPAWRFPAATPVTAVLFVRVYPVGGGCAQVRRSSGLAFQGRKRSSARPASGFPPLRPHSSR